MNNQNKWNWMMNYCKKNSLPPAQSFAWQLAEKKYNELVLKNKKGTR